MAQIKTKKGGKEKEYKVLKKVYNANWRDDVPEEAEAEAINFEFYKNEKSYESPEVVNGDARKRLIEWEKVEAMKQKLLTIS